jgi:hypothetical protein
MLKPGRTTEARLVVVRWMPHHDTFYAHGDEFWYLSSPSGRLDMARIDAAITSSHGIARPVPLSQSSVLEFDGHTHVLKAVFLEMP